VLLGAVIFLCVFGFPSERMLEAEVADYFPTGAMRYLRAHPQQGHMFNLYEWGGYLEWNLPQTQTFIDSRTDIFEYNGALNDYLNVVKLSQSEEILDRYRVTYVLFISGPALPYFLSKSTHWQRIYGDGQSVIYRKMGS
jgi:hypothetical protein